jgi:transposase
MEAAMGVHAGRIDLEAGDRIRLEEMSRSRTLAARRVLRAKIVLMRADGVAFRGIGEALGCGSGTVVRWCGRWEAGGFKGIEEELPGRGRKPGLVPSKGPEIVRLTVDEKPANQTHWSRTSMAKAAGVSPSTVGRIWKMHGLKPHRCESFKISNDSRFEEKLVDVVGLYLDPPEHAVVLSVDEKSQIQALDRTQPGLPLKKGRCGTMTHDYKRNGTTTLFAAMNTLDGTIIAETMPRHRHQEWLAFLKRLDRETPRHLELHIICDNYATHKHATVQKWLEKKKRIHLHFTPTSSSWLNMVERFFRDITDKQIRRGVFKSVPDLEAAIHAYIESHNEAPKPFIWTAEAADILAKVVRARKALNVPRNSGGLH